MDRIVRLNIWKLVFFVFIGIGCCLVFLIKYYATKTYPEKLLYGLQKTHPLYIFYTNPIRKYQEECLSMGRICFLTFGQNVLADIVWLSHIQYVGKVVTRQDIPYLLETIDTLTNINPYRSYPYVFAQLLGPISKTANVSDEKKKDSWIKTLQIAQKGLQFTCNSGRVASIDKVDEQTFTRIVLSQRSLNKDWGKSKNQPPCFDYQLPLHTAFNYFYYMKNGTQAVRRYKVAAMDSRSPEITISMPAVVLGQFGYHQKSALLRYDKYLTTLSQVQNLSLENKQRTLAQAQRFLRKAVFEYSLDLLSRAADVASFSGMCLHDYDCLVRYGFLKKQIEEVFHKCKKNHNLSEDRALVSGQSKENQDFFSKNLQFQLCAIFFYGLKNGYISLYGKLVYPFNDFGTMQFEYGWHPLSEQWRIVSKK